MRIGTGIVMLVVGAVLRFAISLPNTFIDLPTVGVILMGGGFIALAVGVFVALRPKATIETTVGSHPETLAPTKPYTRP